MPENWQTSLLARHQLENAYLDTARAWFDPMAESLAEHIRGADRPILVAFNGCQGSGKTTLVDYLCSALTEKYGLNGVALSLDDFYRTQAERRQLASSVHPLLGTRGVPGTHDMDLLQQTLEQLLETREQQSVAIPRFDKATDDRRPSSAWDLVLQPVQVVLLEGWCLGATPQADDALTSPINKLERDEDPDGQWRHHVNESLASSFVPLYALVDQWVMLCAPSFDCVFEWRCEQERKLAATLPSEQASGLMGEDGLRRFIQHYERLTRHCLEELPARVNHLFRLDRRRQITDYLDRESTAPLQ